ncbi:anti-phage deoxyguanosine triphosphatase [Sphingomonas sp. 3-13AW]|uniref:anti-phage deoxyguanosine triphosphatase n=1 Tax=Sphingomonas sp. 3-13AW TaxID=3050450 RepID=UPI003BB7A942
MKILSERRLPVRPHDDEVRSPDRIDYSRVMHSQSWRALQGKTQILEISDGSFHRTRMTHSAEVVQVGVGVLEEIRCRPYPADLLCLLPTDKQMEAICWLHDIGHPPFGHAGETALHYSMMRAHPALDSGFEGNGQTLRIISKLEKYTPGFGSNLTRRTMLGVLKYPRSFSEELRRLEPAGGLTPAFPDARSPITGRIILDDRAYSPPKCYMDCERDVVDWLLSPFAQEDAELIRTGGHKSFDCSLMDLSDDAAYSTGDLEDAIVLKFVKEEQFREEITAEVFGSFLGHLARRYPDDYDGTVNVNYDKFVSALFRDPSTTKKQIGQIVNFFIKSGDVRERSQFRHPLYRWEAVMKQTAKPLLNALKRFVHQRVIKSSRVQAHRHRGQQMLMQSFDVLASQPYAYLPEAERKRYAESGESLRAICDYLAAMTDAELTSFYTRLFIPSRGEAIEIL